MKPNKTPQIEVLDEECVPGIWFRVITRNPHGSCEQSLPCRVVLTADGFAISFYGPHDVRGAERDYKPLTRIPIDMAPLVAEAFKQAKKFQDKWISQADATSS